MPKHIPLPLSSSDSTDLLSATEQTLRDGFPWLRFPAPLEKAFLAYYDAHTLKRTRMALLVGLFLYALFGLADIILIPAIASKLLFIRFALVCPLIVLVFALSYSKVGRRYLQEGVWTVVLIASLGIIAMIGIDPSFGAKHYYSGLILAVIFAFTFVGMRFWPSIFWALTTLSVFIAVLVLATPNSPPVVFYYILVMTSAMGIGAFSCYLMEHYIRTDFLRSVLLRAEKERLEKTSEQLRRLSAIDELTGIANRRTFEETLDREIQRAGRTGGGLALVILDIDSFKEYNDLYGHRAGDDCLKKVAATMQAIIRRPGDLVARYGGEEFVIILPGTDTRGAVCLAERTRTAIEALGIPHAQGAAGPVITASAGIATFPPGLLSGKEWLIEAADRALYRAKHSGRNRVSANDNMGESLTSHPPFPGNAPERLPNP